MSIHQDYDMLIWVVRNVVHSLINIPFGGKHFIPDLIRHECFDPLSEVLVRDWVYRQFNA